MDFFKQESRQEQISEKDTWKVLISDDEKDIHTLTKTVLYDFEYKNKKLEFISAYTGEETLEILKKQNDIPLLLLDVVMEEDNSGLQVVEKLRNELKNNLTQVVLRTGQPGFAPELDVVVEYAINDYKEKTELTSKKLVTTVVTAIRAYENMKSLDSSKKEIEELNHEIIDTQREVVLRMGAIAEARSKETGMHVKRVAEYTKLLALYYGLSKEEANLLGEASPMHDVGKVAIPDNILHKPSKLTQEEFEIMKKHSDFGYEMLNPSSKHILKVAAIVAFEHHEKWDGTGYPRGLKEDQIHIYGRITALADVFDALGSDRVYKKAWSDDEIFSYFKEQRGKHFDPKLVDIFFEHFNEFDEIRKTFKD